MSDLVLTKDDFNHFREWLNLNLDGLTWQGRFKKEFEQFWDEFFIENIEAKDLMIRFAYAHTQVNVGSLSSWFLWLRDKFINYLFIFKDYSIEQLAEISDISANKIATILRNFFLEEYPYLDDVLSQYFQVGNILSENLRLTFKHLSSVCDLKAPDFGSTEEEIMTGMEVTLFDEWELFLKRMHKDFSVKNFSLASLSEKKLFVKQVKILQEVIVLILVFSFSIYAIAKVNKWYEKSVANKISIFEPQFNWFNKSSVFKEKSNIKAESLKLNLDDIKDISKSEDVSELFDPENYEEESELTLTNFENIPRDLKQADKEASQYEGDAENPNGYRDQSGGRTKIYRVMMTSTNVYDSRDKLNGILKKYEGVPVGESKPGLDVPGGVYYNLYIPSKMLKDFIGEVTEVNQSKVFEGSTSNVKSVAGKTRVFIMVKSI